MSTRHPHQLRTASAAALLGLTALILVAALLGGALAAIRANSTIDNLGRDLRDARAQIDALRDDNARLADQNRRILDQNRVMVRYLRRHGLEVPQTAQTTPPTAPASPTTPRVGGGVTPSPKARPSRSPSTQAGPGPTGTPTPTPSPTPGALDPLCELAPALCPLT